MELTTALWIYAAMVFVCTVALVGVGTKRIDFLDVWASFIVALFWPIVIPARLLRKIIG